MYRRRAGRIEVLLVHPGGPFWRNKDAGAWSIPKGGVNEGEDVLAAARREFEEETGVAPSGNFVQLPSIKYRSGKTVHAWCFEGDCDTTQCKSILATMEWPPKSGKQVEFAEIDKAEFFDLPTAKKKILPAQLPLLHSLQERLNESR